MSHRRFLKNKWKEEMMVTGAALSFKQWLNKVITERASYDQVMAYRANMYVGNTDYMGF